MIPIGRGAVIAALLVGGLAISGGVAQAQGGDTRRFVARPTGSPTLTLDGARTLGEGRMSARLLLTHEARPLILADAGERTEDVIAHRWLADAGLAVGLRSWLDAGLVLPMVLDQRGQSLEGDGDLTRFAYGDPRVGLRAQWFDRQTHDLGLAMTLVGQLPLGDAAALTGSSGPGAEGRAILEVPLAPHVDLLLNAGATLQPEDDIAGVRSGSAWLAGLGAVYRPWPGWSVSLEGTARAEIERPLRQVEESPAAVDAAIRVPIWRGLVLVAGGGAGVSPGIGAPAWRGTVGFEAAPRQEDFDGDRLADGDDLCPALKGGGADGCPVGMPDRLAAASDEVGRAEDPDGDHIVGADDMCPLLAEDPDGFMDDDGCPEPDNDLDGVADAEDVAPLTPEDFDGVADHDGGPDPDDDGDGIDDALDPCPRAAGPGGCPEAQVANQDPHAPRRLGDTIFPARPLKFIPVQPPLAPASAATLDGLARWLEAHPEHRQVEVGVHTDPSGDHAWKRWLSQQRAEQVRAALIARGISARRLIARGYGATRPVAESHTRAGRARNRRVELRLVQPSRRASR